MKSATYQSIVQKIESLPGRPLAVEALWDGDSHGWYLCLRIVMESEGQQEAHLLDSKGWSEAHIFQELGIQIGEQYGIEFFFPSPDKPDDDCPSWLERDQAIRCDNCQKLILPDDPPSPWLKQGLCYHCHLAFEAPEREAERERRRIEGIVKDIPYHSEVGFRIQKEEKVLKAISYGSLADMPIAPFLPAKFEQLKHQPGKKILLIEGEELLQLARDLEQELDQRLDQLQPLESRKLHFFTVHGYMKPLVYKGKEYMLSTALRDRHWEILSLHEVWEAAKTAYKEYHHFRVRWCDGITKRDLAFLRLMGKAKGKPTERKFIQEAFEEILSDSQIEASLQRLEAEGFIRIWEDHIILLEKGQFL